MELVKEDRTGKIFLGIIVLALILVGAFFIYSSQKERLELQKESPLNQDDFKSCLQRGIVLCGFNESVSCITLGEVKECLSVGEEDYACVLDWNNKCNEKFG